jgi:putative phosphoribosyl transferase
MEIPLMRAREHAMMPRPLELVTPRAMFRDRAAAGRALARLLGAYRGQPGVVVIGLARAGVPVAREVADHLRAPIGVVVAHKIGVPGIEEVALGAIAEGGHRVIADSIAWYVGVPPRIVDRLVDRERMELERRAATYRAGLPSLDLRGRTVIIVDDGMATGATMRAAIRSVRDRRPARIVVAVPVAAQTSAEEVRAEVDELVVVMTPPRFNTISASYAEYSPVSDDDVFALTGETARRVSLQVRDMSHQLGAALTRADAHERPVERTIGVPAFDATVAGELGVPRVRSATRWERARGVRGLVILGSGSGASRNSYIERYLAGRLRLSGYATLRVDLFTREEQHPDGLDDLRHAHVQRAAARLAGVCEWAEREGVAGAHRTILAGAGTGAAAVLLTAANRPGRTFAVAVRGALVGLARAAVPKITAPTLFIVGANEQPARPGYTDVFDRLQGTAVLVRVPRAGNSFEEPGALGSVAEHTVGWLDRLDARKRHADSSDA